MFFLKWVNGLVINDSLIFLNASFLCVQLTVFHGVLLLLGLKHLIILFRGIILSLCFTILGLKRFHSISKIWLYVNDRSQVEKTYKIVFFLEEYIYFSFSFFIEGLKFFIIEKRFHVYLLNILVVISNLNF